MFSLIVLANKCGGIAKNCGSLPFKNIYDMKNFTSKTKNNIVIMGKNTWNSLQIKPLPNRLNYIISTTLKQKDVPNGVFIFKNIERLLEETTFSKNKKNKYFVIGGSHIYSEFIKRDLISKIYYTKMDGNDIYPIKINLTLNDLLNSDKWRKLADEEMSDDSYINKYKMQEKYKNCQYAEFVYNNVEEKLFLERLNLILQKGYKKTDRTGTGTLSLFSPGDLSFSLENNTIPLLTTRPLPLKHIFEELMWFLRGQTDVRILQQKGVKVWNANTSREFLDKRGLYMYPVGDLGPSYSFQFRHSGADYLNCRQPYYNLGFDQLTYVINLLKNNPDSRRIIINLWNPSDLDKMSLVPCGFCYQFYVTPEKRLITKVTQRSSDIALAGGWNIASASLLTYMLASICGLKPHKVIWSTGDTHLYLNQLDSVKEQISRKCDKPFPKLYIHNDAPSLENGRDITEFEYTDFSLVNYCPQKKIKLAMNA